MVTFMMLKVWIPFLIGFFLFLFFSKFVKATSVERVQYFFEVWVPVICKLLVVLCVILFIFVLFNHK